MERATRDKFLYPRCPLIVVREKIRPIGRLLGQMWTLDLEKEKTRRSGFLVNI